jgi:glutamate formiminotransferase
MTDFDADYIEALPKYEIGTEVFASDFSQDQGGWMDEVIEKMAADAEGIDIEKLAQEDPLVFVASLSADVIANATAVKNLAMERVESAAGPLDPETKEWVVSTYIETTENARRKALSHLRAASHEEVQEQHKTANSVPDEGLFL